MARPVVSFQNDGEVDIAALTTLGVSAKSGPNPIGFFGTGFKYAVAIILRNGGRVSLYSGVTKYTFGTERLVTREQEFFVVTCNRKSINITTRLGINWEPWMAFRELWCNTKDEPNGWATNKKLAPEAGKTTIVVEDWGQFAEAYENRQEYFVEGKPLYANMHGEVFPGQGKFIFYRGVAVHKLTQPASYNYNITRFLNLTEDRTVKEVYMIPHHLASMFLGCSERKVLEKVLVVGEHGFEHLTPYANSGSEPTDEFLETVEELRRGPNMHHLAPSAREVHDKHRASKNEFEMCELNEDEQKMFDEAKGIVEATGLLPSFHEVQIIPVASLGPSVLGKVHKGVCYISKRAFGYGLDTVTGTIFEEVCHVKMHMQDETRDFQNFLINCIAQLGRRFCWNTTAKSGS